MGGALAAGAEDGVHNGVIILGGAGNGGRCCAGDGGAADVPNPATPLSDRSILSSVDGAGAV